MKCLGNTPKKSNENEIILPLFLKYGIQNGDKSKKFKKNIKNNNTAHIISKKINCFGNKVKNNNKKENYSKDNNIKNDGIKKKDFRPFLYYKLKKKYDSEIFTYNIKKINELIFNIPSKFTASFKDYLLIEEDAEFLKREYHKEEFNKKFTKIFFFYEKYSKTFPNYTILSEGKYMYRNILKKQKMIDELQKIKEEEEDKINSKIIMDPSNETIFTNNTIESIINQKDSFWINSLQDIMHLDQNQGDSKTYEQINLIIQKINQFENIDKSNKQTIYKKEFKKIRNLSKPLYINQINPKLIQIKEKINQIKNYRNNCEINKNLKNNKTIESSYNSISTTINNKSFNNKGIIINMNTNKVNLYEDKKDIFKKRIPCPNKDSSYKKGTKEIEIERIGNLSNKYQKSFNDKIQNDSKFSNSMITNKIKNYFKINVNNYEKRKQLLNSTKKNEFSYNIGSLFNSRKDKCKEFLTDKKLMTVFNKYISNKTKPFKKSTYSNTESGISQNSINSHIKNDYYIITSHYTFNSRINNNREFLDSKRSYDNTINISKKNNNYSNSNINISKNSFLNHTFSSLKKNNKMNFHKNNNKKLKNKKLENVNKNKFYLKTQILKNNNKNKSKNNTKKMSFNNKIKNIGERNHLNHLKTFCNLRNNNNYIINNISHSTNENQSAIIRKNKNGTKVIITGNHFGRNEKYINLKFACGNTFNTNKTNRKKIILMNK